MYNQRATAAAEGVAKKFKQKAKDC